MLRIEEMHGSDRDIGPENDYERALVGGAKSKSFNESEMALFYECMERCGKKVLDSAGVVREAIFQQ